MGKNGCVKLEIHYRVASRQSVQLMRAVGKTRARSLEKDAGKVARVRAAAVPSLLEGSVESVEDFHGGDVVVG